MKSLRTILVALVLSAGLLLPAGSALACEITFEPVQVHPDDSGAFMVIAVVEWEHRNCELDDDDVNIDYGGIEEVSNTGWVKVGRGRYENEIEARLLTDNGTIRVWRDCNKKGLSEGVLAVSR